ncbi:hypothetical protein AMTR_s00093p00160840 [Amborella trichopoda]|uniref:Uncharacterized protein n=1 Tax=Amborella trichopoda TaxID=13333 RepID=W1NPS3_AMBTC|nr:hypothetical protein AMTR_s00093p00160840 [Amborella trichopoda]
MIGQSGNISQDSSISILIVRQGPILLLLLANNSGSPTPPFLYSRSHLSQIGTLIGGGNHNGSPGWGNLIKRLRKAKPLVDSTRESGHHQKHANQVNRHPKILKRRHLNNRDGLNSHGSPTDLEIKQMSNKELERGGKKKKKMKKEKTKHITHLPSDLSVQELRVIQP